MHLKLPNARVEHLGFAIGMVAEIQKLNPVHPVKVNEISSCRVVRRWVLWCRVKHYRQPAATGRVDTSPVLPLCERDDDVLQLQVTDWNTSKQLLVCYSSFGAKILSAAYAGDRLHYMRQSTRLLIDGTYMRPIRSFMHVYSRGLYDTVSRLYVRKDYRLRQTVQRIWDSFEA